ncbi:hypothetical protein NDU88_001076 [Pleurodeles waltl]|uniref:Uncharacterized protein n=1 Tax=Pleurodeles waltl TaxID=8319 RepID=A0AAV7WHA5_PLEWA|nr:hypothetical protein NDU88_001076 [Pleurodeles waltl]
MVCTPSLACTREATQTMQSGEDVAGLQRTTPTDVVMSAILPEEEPRLLHLQVRARRWKTEGREDEARRETLTVETQETQGNAMWTELL